MATVAPLDTAFITAAFRCGARLDRRHLHQMRDIAIEFPLVERGACAVTLGATRAFAIVSCALVDPAPLAPKRGFAEFHVRGEGTGGPTARDDATRLAATIDRLFARGRVVDAESLCVLPGRKVWSVRVDVSVLNDDGNATDAAVCAVSAALLHFRRPELTIRNDEVTVHPPDERDPVPLHLHSPPFTVTSAVACGGSVFATDPTLAEEAATTDGGVVSVAVNGEGAVCGVYKGEGAAVTADGLARCTITAKALGAQISAATTAAMKADETRRRDQMRAQFQWARTRAGVKRGVEAPEPSTVVAAS